ncbi:putative myosin light chain kinase [Smittium culicis]|uniref:Putative myosin light chain kinase n=1 Tax=Smittium culicis TaxID=133412 RepID=A0A1R1YNY8_9FUNG|nr:putative myosin light chain kinase [Smittium culicis]
MFDNIIFRAKGGELFDRIVEQGHFTEDETRIVILQLLLGLNYLHEQGIVHRDIKPENILLSGYEGLDVKLADFGLAKIVGEQSFMKTLCGTPMYVAPEVLKSRSGRVYKELSPPSLNQQILNGIYSFPSPHCDRVSEEAKNYITKMLCVDAELRISAKQALDDPWLGAYKVGNLWKIRGISDFSFEEALSCSESESSQTQSLPSSLVDSQTLASPLASSPNNIFSNSPKALNPIIVISPSPIKPVVQNFPIVKVVKNNHTQGEKLVLSKGFASKSASFENDKSNNFKGNCDDINPGLKESISSPVLYEMSSLSLDSDISENDKSTKNKKQIVRNRNVNVNVVILNNKKMAGIRHSSSTNDTLDLVVKSDFTSPYFNADKKSSDKIKGNLCFDTSINKKLVTVNIQSKPNPPIYENYTTNNQILSSLQFDSKYFEKSPNYNAYQTDANSSSIFNPLKVPKRKVSSIVDIPKLSSSMVSFYSDEFSSSELLKFSKKGKLSSSSSA